MILVKVRKAKSQKNQGLNPWINSWKSSETTNSTLIKYIMLIRIKCSLIILRIKCRNLKIIKINKKNFITFSLSVSIRSKEIC